MEPTASRSGSTKQIPTVFPSDLSVRNQFINFSYLSNLHARGKTNEGKLTIISFGRCVSPVVLGDEGPLAVGMRLVVIIVIVVKSRLGVLLQLLGQVGSRSAGGNVVFVPVLWDLQLFHEAHRPGRQKHRQAGEPKLSNTGLDVVRDQALNH